MQASYKLQFIVAVWHEFSYSQFLTYHLYLAPLLRVGYLVGAAPRSLATDKNRIYGAGWLRGTVVERRMTNRPGQVA